MFGKPEWFREKTWGWGLTPTKWQGLGLCACLDKRFDSALPHFPVAHGTRSRVDPLVGIRPVHVDVGRSRDHQGDEVSGRWRRFRDR